ncbi:hypothetical protein Tco_1230806, partial [Tanacetum coccineum]
MSLIIRLLIEYDTTTLDTYFNAPKSRVVTEELNDNTPPSPTSSGDLVEVNQISKSRKSKPLTIRKSLMHNMRKSWTVLTKELVVDEPDLTKEKLNDLNPCDDLDGILGTDDKEREVKTEVETNDGDELDDDYQPYVKMKTMMDLDVIGLDSFNGDLDDGVDCERKQILRDLRKIKITRRRLVESGIKLDIRKNGNERVRARSKGTMATYKSFQDGMNEFEDIVYAFEVLDVLPLIDCNCIVAHIIKPHFTLIFILYSDRVSLV